jgi:type IV secretory pathway TrbF-like protein
MSATAEGGRERKRGFLGGLFGPKGDDPQDRRDRSKNYVESQRADLGLVDEATRQKNSERRDKRVLFVIIAILLLINLILATKDHTDSLVYRESPNGVLTYMGKPTHDLAPDDAIVNAQLARWIQLKQEVHEPTDAQRIASDRDALYAMTQSGSQAASDLDAARAANPPEQLGRYIRRNDKVTYVDKVPGTQRSYEADVEETTTTISGPGAGGAPNVAHYHWTFTIAKPRLATSEATALSNGAGVYVTEFHMVQKQ